MEKNEKKMVKKDKNGKKLEKIEKKKKIKKKLLSNVIFIFIRHQIIKIDKPHPQLM